MRSALCALLVVCPFLAVAEAIPGHDPSHPRFDEIVRDDFFAGFAGDRQAFDRAMRTCADALKKNPHDPDVLVWEGGGFIFIGEQATEKGDPARGALLEERGHKEQDYAVALDPNNISALITRGATLLSYPVTTPAQRKLVQQGVADFERVLELSKSWFVYEPTHARGELLNGIADGWSRLGERPRARSYFERVVREVPGSKYADVAGRWLAGKTDANTKFTCLGCH
jgi:hypothetical protein